MRTNDLIRHAGHRRQPRASRRPLARLVYAIGSGALVSTILMVKAIPVNPDISNAMQLAAFWQKLGFAASHCGRGLAACLQSWPGRESRLGNVASGADGADSGDMDPRRIALATAEPEERASLFFGNTWKVCPFLITMLATPVFVASFWAMRDLAPTNLRLAGAAAGMFSGAVGAVVYCFHCPELTRRLSPSGICSAS
jgi:hypothetical protein